VLPLSIISIGSRVGKNAKMRKILEVTYYAFLGLLLGLVAMAAVAVIGMVLAMITEGI